MLLCSRILGYIMRRFLRSAMIVFSWFVVPYSRYTNIKVIRRKLPPIRSHLLEIPAVDLAKLIRTRKVSTCNPQLPQKIGSLTQSKAAAPGKWVGSKLAKSIGKTVATVAVFVATFIGYW